jgi:recombination protein RecT
MATVDKLKNELVKKEEGPKDIQDPFKALVTSGSIKRRFEEMLDKEASGFITSLLSLKQDKLQGVDTMTILGSAFKAAALKLPIDPNLGYAWIVPFNNTVNNQKVKQAQFQLGYKGYIQLAQRSGQYLRLNVTEIFEGQLKSYNSLTEELILDMDNKLSDAVIGYAAYFKLINGFEKTVYWTKDKVTKHAKRFSKAFNSGPWQSDFDAMAKKTVLKHTLSTWGILSIEMRTAQVADNSIISTGADGNEKITFSENEVEADFKVDYDTGDISTNEFEGTPFQN